MYFLLSARQRRCFPLLFQSWTNRVHDKTIAISRKEKSTSKVCSGLRGHGVPGAAAAPAHAPQHEQRDEASFGEISGRGF